MVNQMFEKSLGKSMAQEPYRVTMPADLNGVLSYIPLGTHIELTLVSSSGWEFVGNLLHSQTRGRDYYQVSCRSNWLDGFKLGDIVQFRFSVGGKARPRLEAC